DGREVRVGRGLARYDDRRGEAGPGEGRVEGRPAHTVQRRVDDPHVPGAVGVDEVDRPVDVRGDEVVAHRTHQGAGRVTGPCTRDVGESSHGIDPGRDLAVDRWHDL